ncbi:unnamed protein product [Musa acuminata subsp. burmannicoides]
MTPPLTSEGERASWARLNMDVMEMILEHLTIVDHVRFSNVCKSWRSTTIISLHALRAPWLLVTVDQSPLSWGLYTTSNGRRNLVLEIPKEFQSQYCCGSSKGWLIFVPKPPIRFRGYTVHLLNPITGTMIKFYPFMHFIVKGVISTSPLASDFLFAILGSHCMEENISVFLYEPGYQSCQDLEIDDPMDIMFHHGRLYVLTGKAKIMVYAFKPHWKVSIIPIPSLFGKEDRRPSSCNGRLVGSNDDIFVVSYDTKLGEQQQLKVFKVRERGLRHHVVEVDSLGGHTFFICSFSEGVSVSKTKSSSKSELMKPDCIYYLSLEDNLRRYCMKRRHTFRVAGWDASGDILEWFTPRFEDRSSLMAVTPSNGNSHSRYLLLAIIIIIMLVCVIQYVLGKLV